MKLVDANLLLYAVDEGSAHHVAAKRWLEQQLSGAETFAFAWTVLLVFVRLSTNARVFDAPLTAEEALDLVDSWLDQTNATIVHPTARHGAILRELLAPVGTAVNLVTDAHLAALSIVVVSGATVSVTFGKMNARNSEKLCKRDWSPLTPIIELSTLRLARRYHQCSTGAE